MGFDEKILGLIQRLPGLLEHLQTEEATKNALVMPFIAALGYDVFNPQEVVPEFVADVGLKKGEKVDYAIKRNGEIILLVECKKVQTDLSQAEMSQLFRYFAVTKARIAVLTNGVQYWFYSDIEEPNKMDTQPFLELDLSDPRPGDLAEVRRLAKDEFNLDKMLNAANELKYLGMLKKEIGKQLEQPCEEFVKLFYSKVVPGGRFTAAVKDQFTLLTTRAFQQFISERISDRLRTALQTESGTAAPAPDPITVPAIAEEVKGDVVTTEDEMEAFRIVRAIVCRAVPSNRVVMRDAKSYCALLLDDNNRKTICRLHFNGKQKFVGLFDAAKTETRVPLEEVTDLYRHADALVETVTRYETQKAEPAVARP